VGLKKAVLEGYASLPPFFALSALLCVLRLNR
jgi:hypothetical protein